MKLAVTGFVSGEAGSGASASVLVLRELLKLGHDIHFFSKPTFVDPRPLLGDFPNFHFVNVTNVGPDKLRQRIQNIPIVGLFGHRIDAGTYNRLLVNTIEKYHSKEKYDVCLWIGDYTRGRIVGLPTISCYMPVPGTDARSILRQYSEVKKMAGPVEAIKWRILANLRLSRIGLPNFNHSDHLIVTGEWSKKTLSSPSYFGVNENKISTLPLPIDLDLFNLPNNLHVGPRKDFLNILWVGRIVPRKRLDLFLNGAEMAIKQGVKLKLTILGDIKLVSGYDKLIRDFPFQNNLTWIRSPIPRKEVPNLYNVHDVLVQPSEEEDFGSSPAEAQACGLPVIVGHTSGNVDCLCSRDICLRDYSVERVYLAYREMSERKRNGSLNYPIISRKCALQHYSTEDITRSLIYRLESVKEEVKESEITFKYPHLIPEFPL